MKYTFAIKTILHQLGIDKTYHGCDYIILAINLIFTDENYLNGVTKNLYVEIAKEFNTTPKGVDKNIRSVIDIIWKDTTHNRKIIIAIFGARYLNQKPTVKVFLELLYEYIKYSDILQDVLDINKMICPFSKNHCAIYIEIVQRLMNLD